MTSYDAMIILTLPVTEQTLEEKLDKIRAEIEKLGGTVGQITRLGRQSFARPLQKQDAGFYVLITFDMAPAKIVTLRERLKLNQDVFRAQVTLAAATPNEVAQKTVQPAPAKATNPA
ncbi:MAG: 30S ribosomal protein S6 [Lentisphaerae bacterium]|nr:30S ribosomal protein S6 [Lentisphaerota bacterium]